MYNFFFKGADHSLFRRALKSTKNEPVVINILSTDSSLQEQVEIKEEAPVVRKNLSNKFQPSPFGKFFGPRKQRTTPVDMGSFSSWKNKNFREIEQNMGDSTEVSPKMSLADFMNKQAGDSKFNETDKLKLETQKPITQLDSDDPTYRKYSLDSYLHKLEEQAKVKDKFSTNDDLLEPLGGDMQNVVPDSSQDENFGLASTVDVEDVSFDENIKGESFAFETSELDKVRTRLDKLEREAAGEKNKPTEKVLSHELSDLTVSEEDEDDNEIIVDDIEKINEQLAEGEVDIAIDQQKETPKVSHKRFFEINRNDNFAGGTSAQSESTDDVIKETSAKSEKSGVVDVKISDIEADETPVQESNAETSEQVVSGTGVTQDSSVVSGTRINREDILTKDDLKTMTDEIVSKFTEMYKKDVAPVEQPEEQFEQLDEEIVDEAGEPYYDEQGFYVDPSQQVSPYGYQGHPSEMGMSQQHAELQAKLFEMIEANKRSSSEVEEKLRQAELEKNRVAEEYEARLKELEESFKKRDEELKKQAYLDKLKSDIKLKKAETDFRRKEEELKESEKLSSERIKIGVMLKKELESNLNISNLEMDKKLLEVASKLKKEEVKEQEKLEQVEVEIEEVDEDENVEKEKPKKTSSRTSSRTKRKPTTRRSSRSHTRTPRRKIDSDIIGGINFD